MTTSDNKDIQNLREAIVKLTAEVVSLKETVGLIVSGNDGISVRNYERITVLDRDVSDLKAARSAIDCDLATLHTSLEEKIGAAVDKRVSWKAYGAILTIQTALILALAGWLVSHIASDKREFTRISTPPTQTQTETNTPR